MSTGQKLITAYFVVAYAVPLAANWRFQEDIVASYKIFPLTAYSIALLALVYLLFWVCSGSKAGALSGFHSHFLGRLARQTGCLYLRSRLLFALATLALAIAYYVAGFSAFRYFQVAISEVDSPLLLIVNILAAVVTMDLFYSMFMRANEVVRPGSRRYLENNLLAIVLLVSANGTVSMLVALIASFYGVLPGLFHKIIFSDRASAGLALAKNAVFSLVALVAIFILAWLLGEAIKRSSSGDTTALLESAVTLARRLPAEDSFLETSFYYLVASLSSHYYSFLFTNESTRAVLTGGSLSAIAIPIDNLLFRLDYLLGRLFEIPRPELVSISQLNYQLLTTDPISDRTGTSPGVIASFNYLLPFPLDAIACIFYLVAVSRIIDVLFAAHRSKTLSTIGVLLLLVWLRNLFQSPVDFLILVDDAAVFLVALLGLYFARTQSAGRRPSTMQSLPKATAPASVP